MDRDELFLFLAPIVGCLAVFGYGVTLNHQYAMKKLEVCSQPSAAELYICRD